MTDADDLVRAREHVHHRLIGSPAMSFLHYTGRGLQLLAMWLLLVDVFTAGPLGPSFNLLIIGVTVFLAGWLITRRAAGRRM